MRVVVTGGAGFIGRAVVERLAARGDTVVALVRDPGKAAHLVRDGVELVTSDLSSVETLTEALRGADAVAHVAGSYRVGIRPDERDAMWDANVGTTERVLDAADRLPTCPGSCTSPRSACTATPVAASSTRPIRRDSTDGFLTCYDETKYRAHEAAEARIARGAPIVIAMPGQTYGPARPLAPEPPARGRLRRHGSATSRSPMPGSAWVHVHDLADGLVAALDRGRIGEAYSLGGECRRIAESVAIAAQAAGRKPPRGRVPIRLLRAIAPINDRIGGLPGMPDNLAEVIASGDGVTFWANHDKAAAELGYAPRTLAQGVADTWGGTPA